MIDRDEITYVKPVHINGEVGAEPTMILDVETVVHSFMIHNTHNKNYLYVSFDGGTRYKALEPDASLSLRGTSNVRILLKDGVKAKGSGSNTTYESIILRYES